MQNAARSGVATNHRHAGSSDGSDNLSATVAAERAFPAAVAELDRSATTSDAMKRTWTIIGVGDVPGSFRWYHSLLGLRETTPHDDFGQLLDSDGTVLLCLHEWGAHEHPP
jgi:hypothetical protein